MPEPLGTCVIHGNYWTEDCLRCRPPGPSMPEPERTEAATTGACHERALARAGNVFLWAATTGPSHPDATVESAAEQVAGMYLRTLRDDAHCPLARAVLDRYFPEARR